MKKRSDSTYATVSPWHMQSETKKEGRYNKWKKRGGGIGKEEEWPSDFFCSLASFYYWIATTNDGVHKKKFVL